MGHSIRAQWQANSSWKLGEKNLYQDMLNFSESWSCNSTPDAEIGTSSWPQTRIRRNFCISQCNNSYYFQSEKEVRQTGSWTLPLALTRAVKFSVSEPVCIFFYMKACWDISFKHLLFISIYNLMSRHSKEVLISGFFWPVIPIGRRLLYCQRVPGKCTPCRQSYMFPQPPFSWHVVSSPEELLGIIPVFSEEWLSTCEWG